MESVLKYNLKDDLPNGELDIKIKYREALLSRENSNNKEIKGPWEFKFKASGNTLVAKTTSVKLNKYLKLDNGQKVILNEYRSNEVGTKIYYDVKDKDEAYYIILRGYDDLGNEDILISFINVVLKRTKKEPIVEIEIVDNKQLTKELILDKTGIIDVRAKTSKGENIDIEVQLTDQGNMDKRTLFYWGKMYLENIKQGEDYRENDIERWLMFLEKDISETTLKELMSLDTAIEKAEQKIEYLSSDEEAMRIYYERERSLHERANMISSAEKRGKLEVAKNLLDVLDDEVIAEKTGLDIEEIKSLRENKYIDNKFLLK